MINERNIPISTPSEVITTTILINGTPVPQTIGTLGIQVVKEVNRIPFAKLRMKDGSAADEDFPISGGELFIPGNEIEIQVGYNSDENTIFKGIITKQALKTRRNSASELVVECRDKVYKMTLNRNSKYFYNLKDSELCDQLIGDHGLESGDVEETSFENKRLVQVHATDWDFLLTRADTNNKLLLVDDGTLSLKKPDMSSDPVLNLTYGANIFEFEAELDGRSQYTEVEGQSWDNTSLELMDLEANDPGVTEQGNLSSSDLASSTGVDKFMLKHGGQLKTDELQSWIDSKLMRIKLSKIKGRVSFQGFADVKPGALIELNGLGDRFNGKAFVSSVNHDISRGGWTTNVQFGLDENWFAQSMKDVMDKPASAVVPGVNGLQIGIVTALEGDPEGEFRIKVKIPMISSQDEGIWTRVATLDAGKNRGLFFMPEIGDEVVVGFLNDDPRDAIVLGMLNSSSKPAPFDPRDDNNEKGYVSREELKVVFNDDEKSIDIKTPNGNSLVLSDQDGSISLKDENGNSITLDSSGITLESANDLILKATGNLKAEGGTNIELKANLQLKAEASAAAELNSNGTMTVKGAIVQIN
ncbi:MAG TPA: type VI secretion system tip protein VgrG [Sunxiuqinia sp.]|nr:type VI secretion system tip protein VgrG [Sunxiuqinia sp.]